MINKLFRKIIFDPLKLETPANHKIILWIIWYAYSIVFFEMVLTKVPFAIGNTLDIRYLIAIIPLSIFLQDLSFVKSLSDYKNKIWRYVYTFYLVLMMVEIILTGVLYNSFGFGFLIRECAAFFYWILSITLSTIYETKRWVCTATFIIISSFAYFKFLKIILDITNRYSLEYMLSTIGICTLVLVISILVFKYRIDAIMKMKNA